MEKVSQERKERNTSELEQNIETSGIPVGEMAKAIIPIYGDITINQWRKRIIDQENSRATGNFVASVLWTLKYSFYASIAYQFF